MGDNRGFVGGSGSPATAYVITFSPALSTLPLEFDVIISLNGTGTTGWGNTPGWALIDNGSTPNVTPTVTESSRSGTQMVIHVSALQFADIYAWSLQFDGSQTVDALTPTFIGPLTTGFEIFPITHIAGVVTTGNAPAPFLFDPGSGPPVTSIPIFMVNHALLLPAGEAANFVRTGMITVQDGGTSASDPTFNPVSADPVDGWTIDFDGASNYNGYEYAMTFGINGAVVIENGASVKDLNL